MSKVIPIFWDGFKNATTVFLMFFFVILVLVTLDSDAGIGLMLKADTYLNAIKQPVVIGVYCFLVVISTLNSYRKSKS